MSRTWLKYFGIIIAILGGFIVGFAFGISFVSASIAGEVANITSQMIGNIPLVGEWIAAQIKVFLYDLVAGLIEPYSMNLILLYVLGVMLILTGIVCVYYSRSRKRTREVSELGALFRT